MIRVRRSFLEEFRCCVATDYGDEEALIRAIRGNPDPPNWRMEAGTAWHACLERPDLTYRFGADSHQYGQYTFAGEAVKAALDVLGPGLWEVPGSRVFHTEAGPVEVTCTADHVRGLVIQDQKTKFSPADPADYEDALQWRFYLAVHGARVFRYNLWEFRDPDPAGFCELKGLLSFNFWHYPGLDDECRAWAGRFAAWAEGRGLTEFLTPRRQAVRA
jgi:hypothetical protein